MKQIKEKSMEIKVENFTIKLHRAEETSHKEEVKRLATYVSKICKLGQLQEKSSSICYIQKVVKATERTL